MQVGDVSLYAHKGIFGKILLEWQLVAVNGSYPFFLFFEMIPLPTNASFPNHLLTIYLLEEALPTERVVVVFFFT